MPSFACGTVSTKLNAFRIFFFESLLSETRCLTPREVRGNNRSVMPLDVLGGTRTTLTLVIGFSIERFFNIFESRGNPDKTSWQEQKIANVFLQRGIPCRCVSSRRVDYVPAVCTHRPSLLPIGQSGDSNRFFFWFKKKKKKLLKPYCLEEKEVVTRFP